MSGQVAPLTPASSLLRPLPACRLLVCFSAVQGANSSGDKGETGYYPVPPGDAHTAVMDDPSFTTKLAAMAPMVVAAAFPGGAPVKGWWPQAAPPAEPAAKVRTRAAHIHKTEGFYGCWLLSYMIYLACMCWGAVDVTRISMSRHHAHALRGVIQ
jgi:hypothetical protein